MSATENPPLGADDKPKAVCVDADSEAQETSVNGLAVHKETDLTPQERRAEQKYLVKIDCIILPLIAAIYFLASLASFTFFFLTFFYPQSHPNEIISSNLVKKKNRTEAM